MSIRENYLRISDSVADAALRAGRKPEDVRIVAVTKFVDEARILEAIEAGAREVGENRVQELQQKLPFFAEKGVKIHLIGQLQSNKVKYIVGRVDSIQSVDRLSLAGEISRLAVRAGVTQDVMIEVNIGGEEQKGGVAADGLRELIYGISALPGVRVKGLMCVPPAVEEEGARRYFALLRELYESIRAEDIPGVELTELSMGMSGDFRAAIAEGATMVRIGTALFGARR